MSNYGDELVGIVGFELAENWTAPLLMDEIDDAWRKYEIWQKAEESPTKKQRISDLSLIDKQARRLNSLLNKMSDGVRYDLRWHYPVSDPSFALGLSPLTVTAPNSERPDEEPETHVGFPADAALSRAISGVEAIQIAAQCALKVWNAPNAGGFREATGVLAQQHFLGKALPEIFERVFVRKNQQPCKFALSHEGFDRSPGGRFIAWVWRNKTNDDLSMSKARTAHTAVSQMG